MFEVNLDALRKAGFKVSRSQGIRDESGGLTGGTEIIIHTKRIPPKYLTRVK
jgi:hypothetical protein